jgi:metallo-beta-lactamase class B
VITSTAIERRIVVAVNLCDYNRRMRRALVLLIALHSTALFAQRSEEQRKWNEPVAPFRIMSNLFYVGAREVASYLIATPKGHILIDGGFVETAPMILANIAKLGFDIHDVRILLNTHAHFDHAGGIAKLKGETYASFMASEGDAPLLARGGKGDPQFGDRFSFPPIPPDRMFRDGDKVSLGGITLTAHITPGHTRGCTTWSTVIREKTKPYDVVLVCSASVPPEYKLTHNPKYPEAVADYRRTFAILKSLPCDIPLAPHGSFFDTLAKMERLQKGQKPNPFIDPAGYRTYVTRAEAAFEAALKKEQ